MSSSLKHELADHIYQYLCHEAQYSDLPEAAKESLTAASECIEQAYKLNVGCNQHSSGVNSKTSDGPGGQPQQTKSADILPDELLRIFTRHKEFLSQQKDSLIHQLRTMDRDEATSTSNEKPDIRVSSNTIQLPNNMNDHQNNSNNSNINNNTTNSSNMSPTLTNNNNITSISSQIASLSNASNPQQQHHQQQQQQPSITTTKHHNQHPISQLPMTTRKKLSHLRAQIKRQASKAARSRLEKRSSVSGVGNTNTSGGADKSGHFGVSCEATSSTKHQGGDSYHHHNKELHNQPNSSSSTESPSAFLAHHQSTSSTVAGTGGSSADTNTSTNLSPTLHNESGLGGTSNVKLVGQHSLAAPGHHNNNHHHHSIHQKNFKQKIIALLKKFRTDGSDFDSEEQYREALERELIKAAAGRGSRAIEELLEEEIDVEEESGSEPEDWDNISESSTPKPSLRPFFSSTTLDKI